MMGETKRGSARKGRSVLWSVGHAEVHELCNSTRDPQANSVSSVAVSPRIVGVIAVRIWLERSKDMSGQAKAGSGGGGLALLSLATAGKSSSSSNLRSLTEMYCDSFQGPLGELTAGEGRRNFQRYNH